MNERIEAARERLDDVRERLDLSDEQSERIRPILREQMEAVGKLLSDHGIDPSSGRRSGRRLGLMQARQLGKRLDKIRAETRGKLKGILEPEQFNEFKKIQDEWRKDTRSRIMARR